MKCGQIARVVVHVADNDRFARIERCPAQPLRNGKARIRRWVVASAGENYEFIFDDFVNRDPPIIARRANYLHELSHSLAGASASQRECADLLKLLARRLFHSRGEQSRAK